MVHERSRKASSPIPADFRCKSISGRVEFACLLRLSVRSEGGASENVTVYINPSAVLYIESALDIAEAGGMHVLEARMQLCPVWEGLEGRNLAVFRIRKSTASIRLFLDISSTCLASASQGGHLKPDVRTKCEYIMYFMRSWNTHCHRRDTEKCLLTVCLDSKCTITPSAH